MEIDETKIEKSTIVLVGFNEESTATIIRLNFQLSLQMKIR